MPFSYPGIIINDAYIYIYIYSHNGCQQSKSPPTRDWRHGGDKTADFLLEVDTFTQREHVISLKGRETGYVELIPQLKIINMITIETSSSIEEQTIDHRRTYDMANQTHNERPFRASDLFKKAEVFLRVRV